MRANPYRTEAVEHRARGTQHSDVLRISPAWLPLVFRAISLILVVSLAFISLGRVHEHAVGPALIRMEGRLELRASAPGRIASVDVRSGERVHAGQIMARFYDEEERAELSRVERELELIIQRRLLHLSDTSVADAVAHLRSERDRARRRVAERVVRAPRDALVSDVRAHAGRELAAGDVVATLVDDAAAPSVIALLPGHARPQLNAGMPLRLELAGYLHEYRTVLVESVGNEIIGPGEIGRFLGKEVADALPVRGAVVVVKARLPSSSFDVDGQSLRYFDGMQARAEARLRAESILLTLFPALKGVTHHVHL